jgi:hypothetical protein
MAVDGGRKLRRKQEAKEMGARWQENGSVDPYGGLLPLSILPGKRQPIGRDAWCPHLVLNLSRRSQRGLGPAL